ncbi:hypothetical protein PGB90_001786 [Kerria lacca]
MKVGGWKSETENLFLNEFLNCKYLNSSCQRNLSIEKEVITKETSKLFFSEKAQELMKQLTGLNIAKIYRTRTIEGKTLPSLHKFMTTEQLRHAQAEAIKKAYKKLKMPPLIPVNKGETEILEEVPEIIGFSKSKYVFTDITYNKTDRQRHIVVREPNGVLRKALPFERHRMNEIYFPREGRSYQHPKMFQKENLTPLLEKGEYEFILDRACCQFEPDDPEFHDITFQTYQKVNENKAFEVLRSTRHFGPLVFYLCLNKNLDNLILENLETERLNDAILSIQLYSLINPDCEFNTLNLNEDNQIEYIRSEAIRRLMDVRVSIDSELQTIKIVKLKKISVFGRRLNKVFELIINLFKGYANNEELRIVSFHPK